MVKAAFEGKGLAAEGQDEIQDEIYSYAEQLGNSDEEGWSERFTKRDP